MIAGDLRGRIDRVWDVFWSGGISNPLEVIEQISYLMFLRRLDDIQAAKESEALVTDRPIESPIYTPRTQHLRWSRFKDLGDGETMLALVRDEVFPWLRELGGEGSTYSHHMGGARFTIPTANLLTKVVDMLDGLLDDEDLVGHDTKGDLYEYMLCKIAKAGQNGQFRTPRHIIQLMVEMMAPGPGDTICDPACGTAGFLVASAAYLERTYGDDLLNPAVREHFDHRMFHGFDFDKTMLRIGSMNMLLHEVEAPDIRYRDSLAQSAAGDAGRYSLILANPPFAGSLDYETTAEDLLAIVKTKKTELLFLALFLRLLKPGGRAAVIAPEGVLFGSQKANKDLRKLLVEGHKLDAVVKLPRGVFKPYAGVSAAILFFTRTDSGGTDDVWFYEVTADGWSLDDKRTPLLPEEKLGPVPLAALDEAEHTKNNLPDVLRRWNARLGSERRRARTEQSFCVPKADVAANGYDLSLNRYKESIHAETERRPHRRHGLDGGPKYGTEEDDGEAWDFFISYTGVNQAWAEWIAWQLEDAHYRVLIQAWDFVPGSDWMFKMEQGITRSRRMIAVLSSAYLTSVYGGQEWRTVRAADPQGFARKLLPIRIEECERPGPLHTVVGFDLFGLEPRTASAYLLEQVRHCLLGRAKPTNEPRFPAPSRPTPPIAEPALPSAADSPSVISPLTMDNLVSRQDLLIRLARKLYRSNLLDVIFIDLGRAIVTVHDFPDDVATDRQNLSASTGFVVGIRTRTDLSL